MAKKKVNEEKKDLELPAKSSYSVKFTDGVFIQTELTLPEAKAKVKQLEDQDKILKGKNYTAGFYEIV